jgi:hypothetical protein
LTTSSGTDPTVTETVACTFMTPYCLLMSPHYSHHFR